MKYQIMLSLALCFALLATGCSTAWVSTAETIISVAGPALINILEIVAISKGVPVNAATVAKVNTDVANVKTLIGDFAKASTTAAPGVCQQLQSAISTYQADQSLILSAAQVSDSNTQTKIELLSTLVSGTVTGILAVIPACQSSSLKATLTNAPAPDLSKFVTSYNAILTEKTGNPAVDALTAKRKLHVHSAPVRILTLGWAQ